MQQLYDKVEKLFKVFELLEGKCQQAHIKKITGLFFDGLKNTIFATP